MEQQLKDFQDRLKEQEEIKSKLMITAQAEKKRIETLEYETQRLRADVADRDRRLAAIPPPQKGCCVIF